MRVKLRKLRESYGFTQQQFADAVGISRTHYGQIETGEKMASWAVAVRIKEMLNYPGDDLFDDKKFLSVNVPKQVKKGT